MTNYEGRGFGKATLRTATALSINTVYAGLLLRLGGGDADHGARVVVEGEVTPLEMAAADRELGRPAMAPRRQRRRGDGVGHGGPLPQFCPGSGMAERGGRRSAAGHRPGVRRARRG